MLRENVAGSSENYELTAIKVMPDEEDLSKYRIRKYDDNSVVCKGKCDLEPGKYGKVHLVMDLNQDGIPYYREKTQKEIENGYEPSDELQLKMRQGNQQMVVARNLLRAYFVKPFKLISRFYNSAKEKLSKNKIEEKKLLPEWKSENTKPYEDNYNGDKAKSFRDQYVYDMEGSRRGQYIPEKISENENDKDQLKFYKQPTETIEQDDDNDR